MAYPKFNNLLTIYGRKACEEALMDKKLNIFKLHLADSNKPASIIKHCISLAEKRNAEVVYHDKRQLSFISKNAKQDQGIALDIQLDSLNTVENININTSKNLILLDNITNPQNIGMIIRSVAAGFIDGVIIPKKGCAELGALVIKASTGSIFKCPIYRAENIADALDAVKDYQLVSLELNSGNDFYQADFSQPTVFVLGNETNGVSKETSMQCNKHVSIPMQNGVESLNVAITAALIAFHPAFR